MLKVVKGDEPSLRQYRLSIHLIRLSNPKNKCNDNRYQQQLCDAFMSAGPNSNDQLQALYCDHHGWLQGWLRQRLGDRERAADIAQDTFLRLLVSGRLPGVQEGRQYLTQIARNLVVDQWRRQRVEQAYLQSIAHLPEPQTPSLETRAIILESLIKIDAMLDRMPSKVREAFLLAQFDGLSYPQIAERLQVTVSSVQKYMTRAILACYQTLYEE